MLINKLRSMMEEFRKRGVYGVWQKSTTRMCQKTVQEEVIDISDEFVNWLCFANAGMLTRGNLFCINYAIRELPNDSPIIEIGSFCGLSTNLISYFKERHGAKNRVLCCDKWEFEGAVSQATVGDSSITHEEYRNFVRESFLRNVRFFSRHDLPFPFEMLSNEFFSRWRNAEVASDVFGRPLELGGPISFCFIDGNHSYECARKDFENCDEFLSPGGFILFDDSADGSGWEVCGVVAEVADSGRYDLIAKNPNYFFRKR
jgi:hypothetical protein